MFKLGPFGSEDKFYDERWNEKVKGDTRISNICVSFKHGRITSIQFSYLQKGAHVMSKKHGSSFEGQNFEIVRLSNDEYVTGFSVIDFGGAISSLTFHTNLGKHGPFCEYFKSPSIITDYTREISVVKRDRREFGGFFGSFCLIRGHLISIGIYYRPTTSINDAVHGDTYYDHQIPKMVDGFPVKAIRYKPKLKHRILSKLGRALSLVSKVLFD